MKLSFKTVASGLVATVVTASLVLVPAEKVEARGKLGAALAGAAIGGLIVHGIHENNKRRQGTTRRSTGTSYYNNRAALTQKYLNGVGYDAGPVDGKPGARTRSATQSYQVARGYPATGQLTNAQFAALQTEYVRIYNPDPNSPAAVRARAYEAQTYLRELGFNPGGVDGQWGPNSQRALDNFRAANGLQTGYYLSDDDLRLMSQRLYGVGTSPLPNTVMAGGAVVAPQNQFQQPVGAQQQFQQPVGQQQAVVVPQQQFQQAGIQQPIVQAPVVQAPVVQAPVVQAPQTTVATRTVTTPVPQAQPVPVSKSVVVPQQTAPAAAPATNPALALLTYSGEVQSLIDGDVVGARATPESVAVVETMFTSYQRAYAQSCSAFLTDGVDLAANVTAADGTETSETIKVRSDYAAMFAFLNAKNANPEAAARLGADVASARTNIDRDMTILVQMNGCASPQTSAFEASMLEAVSAL